MSNNAKTYILDDQWTDKDALDFTPYVETLADVIQTGNTPLTIGIFGTWGSGKTSLMRMVKKKLPADFTVAWFDAWKYDKEEMLWRAFLLNVLLTVEKRSGETEELKTLKTMLYRGLEFERTGGVTIDLAKLGAKVAEGAIQIGLSFIPPLATLADLAKDLQKSGADSTRSGFEDAIQRERTRIYVEQVRSLEQFQDKFATLIQSYISPNRLVIFVDDLDRCLPEKSIQVLEAIKLFLDVKDCVFVLGVDQEVIACGIEMKYREFTDKKDMDGHSRFTIEGIKYLEKIIQLPFQIPPVEQTDMGDFVHGLSTEWPHEECPKIFAEGLGDNPRQIKRTVNAFLMLWKLAERRKFKLQGRIKPIRLAKVVAIQAVFPDLYNLLLKDEPRYLRELEEHYRSEISEEGKADRTDWVDSKPPKVEPPPALVPFLSRRGAAAVRRILMHQPETAVEGANFAGLPPEELKLYFTLTRRAETPQIGADKHTSRVVLEPQVVRIPAGPFLMGSTHEQAQQVVRENGDDENWKRWVEWEQPQITVELPEYYVGKYPITNREYQAFIRDSKYRPPRGWDGDQFPAEKGDHPVVYVSWSDALAYCIWLSEKSGKTYRLPSEAEWEKAARGEKGLIYPWGDDFDSTCANTAELHIKDTTPVGHFSSLHGDSIYGCSDIAGNVWEWTGSLWGDNAQVPDFKYPYDAKDGRENLDAGLNVLRVLRGGSFYNFHSLARCAYRDGYRPINFNNNVGFRVVTPSFLKV